jgi:hypothetical protein
VILKSINLILRILLGAAFLASGYLKLFPIETFEFNFIDIGVANWTTAPFIARALIGFEFLLGFFLLFNIYLQEFTLKATLSLLAFFTAYLCLQILSQGNNGNCGCFGTYLEMTPLQSIYKNIAMIILSYWLFVSNKQFNILYQKLKLFIFFIALAIGTTSFALPFILNPVEFHIKSQFNKDELNYILPLDKVYSIENNEIPKIDLRKGKHILCLMSLKCEHCKLAAYKMHIMYNRNPQISFYFLLRGNKEKYLSKFFETTRAENIPHSSYNTDDFMNLSGGEVPAIYWLQDGKVVNRSTVYTINEKEILDWISK